MRIIDTYQFLQRKNMYKKLIAIFNPTLTGTVKNLHFFVEILLYNFLIRTAFCNTESAQGIPGHLNYFGNMAEIIVPCRKIKVSREHFDLLAVTSLFCTAMIRRRKLYIEN